MKQNNTFLNDILNWVLFAILVCVLVIVAIVAVIIIIIVACCFVFVLFVSLPFYLASPLVLQRAWYKYEVQSTILTVLRKAKFDIEVQDGWMLRTEIVFEIDQLFDDHEVEFSFFVTLLDQFVRDRIVEFRKDIPVAYVKSNEYKTGIVRAYRLSNDSYRPRRPRRLPKEKEQKMHIKVHA